MSADLGGGLVVRRALPHGRRRLVGPWCFLDHFGPLSVLAGDPVRAVLTTALQREHLLALPGREGWFLRDREATPTGLEHKGRRPLDVRDGLALGRAVIISVRMPARRQVAIADAASSVSETGGS